MTVGRRDFLRASAATGTATALGVAGTACTPPPTRNDVTPSPGLTTTLPVAGSRSALIVGGGIAGLSAALELAERGYAVTVREAAPQLGGRLATRDLDPGVGRTFRVEHGLHMWFDNYHTFRDIRSRLGIDHFFRPYEQVNFIFRTYQPDVLESQPKEYPANLLNIIDRSPNLDWPDVVTSLGIFDDVLTYRHQGIYERLDRLTFPEWKDLKQLSKPFWEVLLEPAASVTLNDVSRVSAAEMVMYQHFFFLSQPRAMDRTITTVDHGTAVIDPWAAHLRGLGVVIETDAPVAGLRFVDARAVGVVGEPEEFDWVILASEVGGTRQILARSVADDPAGTAALNAARALTDGLATAPPYKILRVWLDRPPNAERPDVIETPQHQPINLIAQFHLLEEESRHWAAETGGAILEFHLYANEIWRDTTDDQVWDIVRPVAMEVLPELTDAVVLGQTVGSYENFTSFEVGQGLIRPSVDSAQAAGVANLMFAGDWVQTAFPSALMERAAVTGRLAANRALAGDSVRQASYTVTTSNGPGLFGFG